MAGTLWKTCTERSLAQVMRRVFAQYPHSCGHFCISIFAAITTLYLCLFCKLLPFSTARAPRLSLNMFKTSENKDGNMNVEEIKLKRDLAEVMAEMNNMKNDMEGYQARGTARVLLPSRSYGPTVAIPRDSCHMYAARCFAVRFFPPQQC